MIYPIRTYGDPVLRRKARPVAKFNDSLKELAASMIETMYDANGVGLAAPQIGLSVRLFVGLELDLSEEREENKCTEEELKLLSIAEKRELWKVIDEHVMINLEILQRQGVQYGPDGCLSLPGLQVEKIQRDDKIEVRYQDLEGNWHQKSLEGHLSHVVQHEYDHLEGILYIDRLPAEEKQSFINEHRQQLADMQRSARLFLKQLKKAPELTLVPQLA